MRPQICCCRKGGIITRYPYHPQSLPHHLELKFKTRSASTTTHCSWIINDLEFRSDQLYFVVDLASFQSIKAGCIHDDIGPGFFSNEAKYRVVFAEIHC